MASSGRKKSLSGPCTSTPSKRKKYVCKYQQFWEKEFTWLKKSDTGEDMAHCKLCNTNISVTAGALYDVKRHAKRSTHVTAVEASSKTKSITNIVDDKKSSSVILSETLFSNFVAEHNWTFSLADQGSRWRAIRAKKSPCGCSFRFVPKEKWKSPCNFTKSFC
jgi:hypothetical protein